jgi:hypothetical protein
MICLENTLKIVVDVFSTKSKRIVVHDPNGDLYKTFEPGQLENLEPYKICPGCNGRSHMCTAKLMELFLNNSTSSQSN